MSRQERRTLTDLPGEEFQLGATTTLRRQELLEPDAFSNIPEAPSLLTDALRHFAGTASVKGLVFVGSKETGSIGITVLEEHSEAEEASPCARAMGALLTLNLQLGSIYTDLMDIKGKPLEDVEEAVRQEIRENPQAELIGFFRFTD